MSTTTTTPATTTTTTPTLPPAVSQGHLDMLHKFYAKVESNIEKIVAQKPFLPEVWLKWSQKHGNDKDTMRNMRLVIQHDTFECVQKRQYTIHKGQVIALPINDDDSLQTVQFDSAKQITAQPKKTPHYAQTTVQVLEMDCLEAALQLKQTGLNPIVLNMASSRRPGGGYKNGSAAQEENLFRRTNYYEHLENTQRASYPLSELGGIHSPNICVFKMGEASGYAYMPQPVTMAFMAVAAYRGPTLELDKKTKLFHMNEKMAYNTLQKMHFMLDLAWKHGHDCVVLSAFGSGAYGNPPNQIARLFAKALNSNTYKGKFKNVTFAIIEDHNSKKKHNPEGNLKPFRDVFGSVPKVVDN